MRRCAKSVLWTIIICNSIIFVVYVNFSLYDLRKILPDVKQRCKTKCTLDLNGAPDQNNHTQKAKNDEIFPLKGEIATEKKKRNALSPILKAADPWLDCPRPDCGRESTFLTCAVGGRLGNAVWSYLSVWAGAKKHNLRPIYDQEYLRTLYKFFEKSSLRIPSAEEIDERCNTKDYFTDHLKSALVNLHSRNDTLSLLENPPMIGFKVLKYDYYIFNSEDLVPYWKELKSELVLKKEYTLPAQRLLENFRSLQKLIDTDITQHEFDFVGVHARMTDYINHMSVIHPGSTTASPQFYSLAMDWMTKMVGKPLIFVIVSDDNEWAFQNIAKNRTNAYMGGNSDLENPGFDLALLASCNHTIFAYGTFALTGAFLASQPGGFNVIFDPLNGTITKEMEFAANLPGWRIMDNEGNFNYQGKPVSYEYYLHPKMT